LLAEGGVGGYQRFYPLRAGGRKLANIQGAKPTWPRREWWREQGPRRMVKLGSLKAPPDGEQGRAGGSPVWGSGSNKARVRRKRFRFFLLTAAGGAEGRSVGRSTANHKTRNLADRTERRRSRRRVRTPFEEFAQLLRRGDTPIPPGWRKIRDAARRSANIGAQLGRIGPAGRPGQNGIANLFGAGPLKLAQHCTLQERFRPGAVGLPALAAYAKHNSLSQGTFRDDGVFEA